MDTILQIVVQTTELKIYDIISVGAASNVLYKISRVCIQYRRDVFPKLVTEGKTLHQKGIPGSKKCNICHTTRTSWINPFNDKLTCMTCRPNMVSLTDVKKTYKFTDEDLVYLDKFLTRHSTYRNDITLFLKKDVLSLCILKYGSLTPPAKIKKTLQSAKEKRFEQLNKVLSKHIDSEEHDDIMNLDMCKDFLRNGAEGIRKLEANLSLWNKYKSFVAPYKHMFNMKEFFTHFKMYIKGDEEHIINEYKINTLRQKRRDNIEEKIRRVMEEMGYDFASDVVNSYARETYIRTGNISSIQRCFRFHDLNTRLQAYGLKYRDDSVICNDFADGKVKDIDEVVRIMREMDFFYNMTNYSNVVKHMLDNAYRSAKDRIYSSYGWIEDRAEYSAILSSLVNRENISKSAKKQVLKKHKGVVPEFVQC